MPAAATSWVGLTLSQGRYVVADKLGRGGMAQVYRARDLRLNCDVVLKVPWAHMLDGADFVGRFQREVGLLAQLNHPHIVKIQDVGEHDGVPFAVLQYLAGGSLNDRRPRGPDGEFVPLEREDLKPWLLEVAATLDFLHRENYIHRDVKPDNILFDRHGNAFLSDFGVAKVLAEAQAPPTALTGTGMTPGTPMYLAPEMVRGEAYEGQVDQYALAVTVYQLLSGRYPFEAPNAAMVAALAVIQEAPRLHEVRPSIPRPVSDAVHRALAKNPRDRFPDCVAFANAVLGTEAPDPEPAYQRMPPSSATLPTMEQTIRRKVRCPGCGNLCLVPETARGKPVRCPACQQSFRMAPKPAATEANRQPALTETDPGQLSPSNTPPAGTAPIPPLPTKLLPEAAALRQVWPRLFSRNGLLLLAGGLVLLTGMGVAAWKFGHQPSARTSASVDQTNKKLGNGSAKKQSGPADSKAQSTKAAGLPDNPPRPASLKEVTNSIGMKFVLIPAGTFWMGGGGGKPGEKQVEIKADFYLGVTEVTQGQWRAIIGNNASHFSRNGGGAEKVKNISDEDLDQFPVERVSWEGVQVFIRKLNEKEGSGILYRLPQEAEWEYACRGGATSKEECSFDYYFQRPTNTLSPSQANFNSALRHPSKVGSYEPNRLGLHDMHGNVWEWCEDAYDGSTSARVIRGGSWGSGADYCRAASRGIGAPSDLRDHLGFRLALVPTGK